MYLVQILLPLYDNDGIRLPQSLYAQVRNEMVDRFGGMTAYARAPASGIWEDDSSEQVHDELVIYEIMTESEDVSWWREYRTTLEQRFRQEKLVVRMHPVQVL